MTIQDHINALQELIDDPTNAITGDSDLFVSLDEDGIYPALELGIVHCPSGPAIYIEVDLD